MANKRAMICGGGIGGLVTALSLLEYGWQVTVLEQSPVLGDTGAGIQISPNGCKVLRELRLLENVQQRAFAPEKIEMRIGQSGREVFSIPLKGTAVARWGAPYLHVHRSDLTDVLATALKQRATGSLQMTRKIVGYENRGSQIAALLDNGNEFVGDLLIGADGIHSVIREQMLGKQAARFTGNVAWRATVPIEVLGELTPPPTACVWVGQGKHAVTYRLRGGELANFVGVVERGDWQSESWTDQGTREEALADFDDWHPFVRNIIDKAETHYRWALFDRDPLPRWHDGRAVLVGDACHPMLPFLAQGATMAMEDGLALARSLTGDLTANSDVNDALNGYFNSRISRTSQVQAGARKNMKVFHKPAIAYAPVQLATRMKPDLMHQRMDWIYDYEVPEAPGKFKRTL